MSDLAALGSEWLALGGGWAPGMVSAKGRVRIHSRYGDTPIGIKEGPALFRPKPCGVGPADVPDLTDPATEGACLGVLRGLADDTVCLAWNPTLQWWQCDWPDSSWSERRSRFYAASRPAALVAALRAIKGAE